MAPIFFGCLRCPLKRFSFFSYFFGRRTHERLGDDELNVGITSFRTNTVIASDKPHFPIRPTPPSTSPIAKHLRPPPRSCKRKALLVGVEHNKELAAKHGVRPLEGPHKDVRDMSQFLISKFKFNNIKYFEFNIHYQRAVIITLMTLFF